MYFENCLNKTKGLVDLMEACLSISKGSGQIYHPIGKLQTVRNNCGFEYGLKTTVFMYGTTLKHSYGRNCLRHIEF
ncbi:MAG TPA: hypothetical protein DEF18_00470 [Muricauda sp.]|nr:hypothetical protein [Allomuricauda sp.]HBU76551.1 hypothetical protein [Allomuricauda sp.]